MILKIDDVQKLFIELFLASLTEILGHNAESLWDRFIIRIILSIF